METNCGLVRVSDKGIWYVDIPSWEPMIKIIKSNARIDKNEWSTKFAPTKKLKNPNIIDDFTRLLLKKYGFSKMCKQFPQAETEIYHTPQSFDVHTDNVNYSNDCFTVLYYLDCDRNCIINLDYYEQFNPDKNIKENEQYRQTLNTWPDPNIVRVVFMKGDVFHNTEKHKSEYNDVYRHICVNFLIFEKS